MKLETRILGMGIVLATISGGLTVGIATEAFDSIIVGQVIKGGISEITELALNVEAGTLDRNENALLRELQETQKRIGAREGIVLDMTGIILADTDIIKKGKPYIVPDGSILLPTAKPMAQREGRLLRIAAPVWEKSTTDPGEQFLLSNEADNHASSRIGTVILILPLDNALAIRGHIVIQLVLIISIIGLAAVLGSVLVARGFLRPVYLLIEGTQKIAKGEYGTKIPVHRADEVGHLANAFNQMSRILAETTVSREFMDSVFNNMTEPMLVVGVDGRIEVCNKAALDLTGYTRNEVLTQPLEMIIAGAKCSLDNDKSTIDESVVGVKNVERTLVNKKGDRIEVLYSSSRFNDISGNARGLIVVARDMTERKMMENIVRRSEKMSAVGQLAAGVAHEINNPLGVILGYSQALVRRLKPADDQLEVPLRSIEKEALRCKNLVQDLLIFSRISKVEREPADLNKIVTAALSLVKAQARMEQVTVVATLAESLPHFLANPNQIQQVIINLATNALDAMENAGTLTVKTELRTDGPMSWVCLRVHDTGSGIPAEIISKIFEPFFTTKPVGKGTGLGLSLIHEIVKKHSGTIDVQSKPGSTEFCIKFPVRFTDQVSEHPRS